MHSKIKLILLSAIIIFFLTSNVFGQIKVEGQIGGSNFLGFSMNTGFEIPLMKKSEKVYFKYI